MLKRLQYHAKQIGTGILISGLGIGAYFGFSSVFGKKSESDSKIEEINENSLISLKNENQYPLTTQRIAEALSKSIPQSFDTVDQPKEELVASKQISKLKKNNYDLDNLDNLQLNYRSKFKRAIPITSEFRVNTYTTAQQKDPAITSLTNGGFVVVWSSNWQDGFWYRIYGRRYNATGNPIGSEFRVNTYTNGNQLYSAIAGTTDGGFVVVWTALMDGSNFGISGQQYNVTGDPIGTEFQVNTYTSDAQQYPAITGLTDGGFIVVWESNGQDGDGWGVYGQQYDATGNPIGTEFQVNTYTTDGQGGYSTVASLTDGGFVVVWSSYGQDGYWFGIYGQRYNTTGNPIGSEFQVNTYTTRGQSNSGIAGLTDGGFVVVWQSDGQDVDLYGVYGQRYNATGNPTGPEFQVNTYTINDQKLSAIAGLTDGGFVVVWQSNEQDGNSTGIYSQQYNATGNPIGTEFQVNTYTSDAQQDSAITGITDGKFVVVWQSDGQDGDLGGIYGRIFSSNITTSTTTTTTTTIPTISISTTAALTTTMGLTTTAPPQSTTSSSTNIPTITTLTTTPPLSTATTTATVSPITTSLPITTTMPITSLTTSVPTTTQTSTTTTQTLTTATTQMPTTTLTSTTIYSGKDDNTTAIVSSIVGAIVGITAIAAGITFFAVKRCKRQAYDLYTESIDLEERSASMSEREVIRSKQEVSGAELSDSYTEIPLFKNGQRQNVSSENDEQEVTLEQKQIKWSDIQLRRELGSGFFGTVHKAFWQETKVAVKQLQQNVCDEKSLKEFKNEAKLMATLKHPNIVTFYGMGIRPNGNMFIVMEYMSQGSLYDYLHSEVELSWEEVLKIAKHIAKGLNFLHNKKVLHRDLRSPNVLLNKTQAKIADFGLTRLTTKENIANTVNQAFGSPRWMASELFKVGQQQYTKKSDIYSYGIILWELVAREEPFAEIENPMQIPVAVVQGMKNPIPNDCEPKYAELIKCCWNDNPADRPSAKEAIDTLERIKTRRKSQIIEQQATSSKCFKELSPGYSDTFQ